MDLYEHIASLNTVEECCRFFDDLCAITELRAMEQRFDVGQNAPRREGVHGHPAGDRRQFCYRQSWVNRA